MKHHQHPIIVDVIEIQKIRLQNSTCHGPIYVPPKLLVVVGWGGDTNPFFLIYYNLASTVFLTAALIGRPCKVVITSSHSEYYIDWSLGHFLRSLVPARSLFATI